MSSRQSERLKYTPVSLNPRIQSLFHHVEGDEPKFDRRLEKIHTNPAIFLVRNFLSPVDLEYIDRNITQHASKFKTSYTEDESGNKCISEERTSTYIYLDKGKDTTIRNLEMRASGKDSVGNRIDGTATKNCCVTPGNLSLELRFQHVTPCASTPLHDDQSSVIFNEHMHCGYAMLCPEHTPTPYSVFVALKICTVSILLL